MKIKRSVVIPLILLVYLGVMSYIGRGVLAAGHDLYYFGIIAITLLAIFLLHLNLRRRERNRRR